MSSESKAHVVVESSCKFGKNGFFFFLVRIYIYIYFVYPFFFFFSFFSRGGRGGGQVGGRACHAHSSPGVGGAGALGRRALSTMQLGKWLVVLTPGGPGWLAWGVRGDRPGPHPLARAQPHTWTVASAMSPRPPSWRVPEDGRTGTDGGVPGLRGWGRAGGGA